MEFTFDTLPQAISLLADELKEIKRLLQKENHDNQAHIDNWLDLDDLVNYDPGKRSKPTFYGYVRERSIPFHKRGKKLLFLKSEIDAWLKEGRKQTLSEIENDAAQTLKIRRVKK